MNPLPDITLMGFLDWMDANRYAFLPPDQTLEEFLLNGRNRRTTERLAEQYLRENPPGRYANSPEGRFEERLDLALASLKRACMDEAMQYANSSHAPYDYEHFVENTVRTIISPELLRSLHLDGNPRDTCRTPATPESIVDSMRAKLEYAKSSEVEQYLSRLDGTSAKAVKDFLAYFREETNTSDKNDNVPSSVIRKYIRHFADETFHARGLTGREKDELQSTLERAFFGGDRKSKYFRRITSMEATSERYLDRTTRYKCVFLAEGSEFYELVNNHWQELNDYTGDHLDVFYNPDELLVKGYMTADSLMIRQRITEYPCIYLWHTSLQEGGVIPVGPISSNAEDVLSLVKTVVDDIARGASFKEVVDDARANVNRMWTAVSALEIIEQEFLNQLFKACAKLQAAPDMYGSATENQRNRHICDMLDSFFDRPYVLGDGEHEFAALDETRRGMSQGGKAAGKIDIFVKLDRQPYAIIEGLNLDGKKTGEGWDKGYLANHVARLGLYDENGLRRNVVLIYVKSGSFQSFYDSLLGELRTSGRYAVRNSKVCGAEDVSDRFRDYANLRVALGKYLYNGQERSLYFFVVGMIWAGEG